MCQPTIPLGEDRGKLKQENRMNILSKWLIATAISIFSFLFILMIVSGATSTNSTGAIPACRGVICS